MILELEHNTHCVAFQKDPEKGYHWNDPSQNLHAYWWHEVVCVTCFPVNKQDIGADTLFINSDLCSMYYITKKNLLYTHSILMLKFIDLTSVWIKFIVVFVNL